MTNSFYQNLDGVMLVFDVTNDKSFYNLTKWLNQINQIKPCPYMISGNKADLENERIVSDDEIKEVEEKFNAPCFLTSAMTGMNVDNAFHSLINMIVTMKTEKI